MNIPNLPTDNLYKFIALSGVAFAIFCAALVFFHDIQVESERAKLIMMRDIHEERSDAFVKLGEFMRQVLMDLAPHMSNEELIKRSLEQFDRTIVEFNAFSNDTTGPLPELAARVEGFRVSMMWRSKLVYGFWSGIAVAFVGFILWYFKLQRYQDRIVKKEALAAKKES